MNCQRQDCERRTFGEAAGAAALSISYCASAFGDSSGATPALLFNARRYAQAFTGYEHNLCFVMLDIIGVFAVSFKGTVQSDFCLFAVVSNSLDLEPSSFTKVKDLRLCHQLKESEISKNWFV